MEHKTFVINVAALYVDSSNEMHSSKKAQIISMKVDEAATKVLSEYADFANIFSSKLAVELLEHTRINDHAIELIDD